jgi:hypothetical protein
MLKSIIQSVAKLTYSKSGVLWGKISGISKKKYGGEVFTKKYGSEGSNFSSCFLQIKNIN